MAKLGSPQIEVETYKSFIGKGLLKQVEQLLRYTGGVPADEFGKCFEIFRGFYNSDPLKSTSAYEGVHDALNLLKSIPSKLAICTQKMEEPARVVLNGLDLDQYFDGFAFGDSLEVMKPNPEMVTFATQSFQKGPLIYVGDSETDSLTAQNAGAIFLLFNGGYRSSSVEEIDHYAVFESHAEIPHLVERILSDVF